VMYAPFCLLPINRRPLTEAPTRVIGVAAARIPALADLGTYYDPPYAQSPAFLLSCAEVAMAHVCAAAPVIYTAFVQLKRTYCTDSQEKSHASSHEGQAGTEQPFGPGQSNKKSQGTTCSSMNMSDVAIMGREWMQSQRRSQGSVPSCQHIEYPQGVYSSSLRSVAIAHPAYVHTGIYRDSQLSTGESSLVRPPEVVDRIEQV
jgi:hypothetical protein